MNITDKTIEYVAALSHLELNEEEKEKAKKDLSSIIEYMNIMNELDTTNIEPMSHVFPIRNVFREDEVTNVEDRDNLLANAPEQSKGFFKVPKAVD